MRCSIEYYSLDSLISLEIMKSWQCSSVRTSEAALESLSKTLLCVQSVGNHCFFGAIFSKFFKRCTSETFMSQHQGFLVFSLRFALDRNSQKNSFLVDSVASKQPSNHG